MHDLYNITDTFEHAFEQQQTCRNKGLQPGQDQAECLQGFLVPHCVGKAALKHGSSTKAACVTVTLFMCTCVLTCCRPAGPLHAAAASPLLLVQMYTDLRAELDDVQGGFCPGLEAPFGQLNIAFKRLTVPNFLNPDGSVPPSTHPGLPWWDMMRYMWRGVASVRVRGLTAVLANTDNPHVGLRDEKLALTAATLSVAVVAGRIDLTTTKMSTFAHTAAPGAGPGACGVVLLLCSR